MTPISFTSMILLKKNKKYLNYDLKSLQKWLLANKISLNCSKTELNFFNKPRTSVPENIKIKLNGTKLDHVHAIKYLGIYLDETLSGDQQCIELTKKLSRANGILAKSRHYATTEIKSIYHALFSSHLKYGSQIWGQNSSNYVNKIFTLQKSALRLISFSDFRAHSNPLFRENRILKLKDQITLENCLMIHDYLNNRLPSSFENYFNTTKHLYNCDLRTRNSEAGCVFIPFVNTTKYGLNSIKRKAIIAWNHLARLFIGINMSKLSRNNLKIKIRNILLETYT